VRFEIRFDMKGTCPLIRGSLGNFFGGGIFEGYPLYWRDDVALRGVTGI